MGGVVHFEIPASDPEKSGKFYKKYFKWNLEKMKEMDYWMAKGTDVDKKTMMPLEVGVINGAITKRESKQDMPTLVIAVDSIDKILKMAKDDKMKIVMDKQKVMDMGWYAKILDPDGNIIGVWEYIKKM